MSMGQLMNAGAGAGQPQNRFTNAGESNNTYESPAEEEMRPTGMRK